jgi:UPF0271 protein
VLLNVDAGELDSEPEELAASAHLLNVACGGHAGDEASMRRTLQRARSHGCRVGAHPSYPDREHFGRRRMDLPYEFLEVSLRAQVGDFARIAREEGLPLGSLKPHGALYHAANADAALADRVASVARDLCAAGASLVGPPRGELARAAKAYGLGYLPEGFADRRYEHDGTLRDRRHRDALLGSVDEAVAQARELAARGELRTLCVHGDSPLAVPILRALRAAFP